METAWFFLMVTLLTDNGHLYDVEASGAFETEAACHLAIEHNRPVIGPEDEEHVIFADCQLLPIGVL